MPDPTPDTLLRETYRLAKENNELLHRMRRNAFFGGIIKFIFYVLILVVAPLWVYSVYLAPLVQNLEQTMQQAQNANTKAQNELTGLQSAWQQLQSKLPGFGNSAATSTQ